MSSTTTISQQPRRLFYGWYIAAAGFVSLWIHAGIGFYSFPVFFVELFEHLGWSRGETAMGFSITFIGFGLASPVVGRFIASHGPRVIVIAGALLMSTAFVLFSVMQELWQYYLICFVLALGWCCTGSVPTSFAISDWFEKKRGKAMGIMMVGVGLGGLVCVPLTRLLINHFQWRVTFGIYAVSIPLLLVPVAAAILRRRPPELLPDGEAIENDGTEASTEKPTPPGAAKDWTFGEAARTGTFWVISAAFILAVFGQTAILVNQVAFFQDIGISPARAASALGFCAFLGIAGKLFFGAMADRFPTRYAMALCFALQALGTVLLVVTPVLGSPVWFVLLWGFAMGGVIALQPLVVAECFGLESFGVILGMVYVFTTIGASAGAPFAGFMYDLNQSYTLPFGCFVATYGLAAALSFLAVPPSRPS